MLGWVVFGFVVCEVVLGWFCVFVFPCIVFVL